MVGKSTGDWLWKLIKNRIRKKGYGGLESEESDDGEDLLKEEMSDDDKLMESMGEEGGE